MFYEYSNPNIPLTEMGGKGKNLCIMNQYGIKVPEFFVISRELYRLWLKELGGLHKLKSTSREKIFVLTSILFQKLGIKSKLFKYLEQIDEDICSFAVRSSANIEDGYLKSFPGIFSTELNIKTLDNIYNSIINCYLSVLNNRVVEYLKHTQYSLREIEMAVVVQRMLFPSAAGVMFTCDTSRRRQYITLIEAVYGLGEGLVCGELTPDLYEVNNNKFAVLKIRTAKKIKMFKTIVDGCGIEKVLVPLNRQKIQVLTNDKILELTKIGKLLEHLFVGFQDIEWAYENKFLYILQSRPLVTPMIYRRK